MAAFGLTVGLIYMKDPQNLTKPLAYTRKSCKYVGKLAIMILLAAIPAIIFLNPFWGDINTPNQYLALILWACQSIGFFSAILALLLIAPLVCAKAGMEEYSNSEYIAKCKKIEERQE